jgi:DNA-binding transcriptional LysR family regulator
LTKSIQKLEDGVGLQLFDRDGAMRISAVGREFLTRARRLLEESEGLSREVSRLTRAASGQVAVGCGPLMPEAFVAPAVSAVLKTHPNLEISVEIGNWLDFPPLLRIGRLDFFVANLAMLRDEPDLEIAPFPPEPVVWFARPGHPLVRQRRVPAQSFFSHPFAIPALPSWIDEWLQQQAGASRDSPFRSAVTCSHYPALKEIVRGSYCVSAATPVIVTKDFAAGTLAPITVDIPPLILQAGLVWLRHRTLSPAARALADSIRRHVETLAKNYPVLPTTDRQTRAPSRKSGASTRK